MNALRNLRRLGSTSRKALCAVTLAACAGNGLADELADEVAADTKLAMVIPAAERPTHRSDEPTWVGPSLPASWTAMDLAPPERQQPESTALPRASDLPVDDYLAGVSNFNNKRSLFRTRKDMLYRDTLRLLLTKRQVRVWLRDNLHVQCELKRFRTMDEGRKLGLKVGVSYRFD